MLSFQYLRSLPHRTKMKAMQITCGAIALLLIIAWILTSQMAARSNKETTFFQALLQGASNTYERFHSK